MLITKQENYTLVTSDIDDFNNFLSAFNQKYNDLKNQHLIIDLSCFNDIKPEQINKLRPLIAKHKSNKKSLIIVNQNINIDLVLDDIICTPTLLEAEDTLQMEAIERDLGF